MVKDISDMTEIFITLLEMVKDISDKAEISITLLEMVKDTSDMIEILITLLIMMKDNSDMTEIFRLCMHGSFQQLIVLRKFQREAGKLPTLLHAGKALRADWTAVSTSSDAEGGTEHNSLPVAGSTTCQKKSECKYFGDCRAHHMVYCNKCFISGSEF